MTARRTAGSISQTIAAVIAEGEKVTYDLRPMAPHTAVGTSQVADVVLEKLGI